MLAHCREQVTLTIVSDYCCCFAAAAVVNSFWFALGFSAYICALYAVIYLGTGSLATAGQSHMQQQRRQCRVVSNIPSCSPLTVPEGPNSLLETVLAWC